VHQGLLLAQGFQQAQHLAFQALEQIEGDVEEIARAAGGIEHARVAQLLVELAHDGHGFLDFVLGCLVGLGVFGGDNNPAHLDLHHVPVGAQRLLDGRPDQALDVGARVKWGAQGVALFGIQGAFQQGAEDGGLDVGPVAFRRLQEKREGFLVELERLGWENRPPLKRRILPTTPNSSPPSFILRQRSSTPPGNDAGWGSHSSLSALVNRPSGSRPTSSANMVNRQRMRNWAISP